jgi:hypothetical protein
LRSCACAGPQAATIREVLYAVACTSAEAIHARDFVRHAEQDHRTHFTTGTAVATLAVDPRFCWGGKGIYGLYRHGLLPGPRNLEQAARILLVAAGHPFTYEVLDYCLKQMGYRYNIASLRNAVSRSPSIARDRYGMLSHPHGEKAQLELRSQIPLVPWRNRKAWVVLREETAKRVRIAVAERDARLQQHLADTDRFGMNWET